MEADLHEEDGASRPDQRVGSDRPKPDFQLKRSESSFSAQMRWRTTSYKQVGLARENSRQTTFDELTVLPARRDGPRGLG